MGRLDGKTAIVVGSATGIGAGSARRMALEGASVVLADIAIDAAQETSARIRAEGGDASAHEVDVRDEMSVQALMDETFARYGRIDALHNNTISFGADTGVAELTTDVWEQMLQVGLRGYMYASKFAIPHMLRGGGGAIVNTSSVVAWAPQPSRPAYSVVKGGILSLTASIVATYGKQKIRCNAICPGFIVTERTDGAFSDEFRAMVIKHIPDTRLGTPDDVGKLAAFLVSDDADYITGQTIAIDGGLTTPIGLYSDLPLPPPLD